MIRAFRLLLIDDDLMDIELAAFALSQQTQPYVLTTAQSGDEALALLHEHPQPDLILLDLNMPGMNGLEVLTAIKSHEALRMIPVVMFTTSQQRQDIQRAYERHVSGFLMKPRALDEQLALMSQVLEYWTQTSTTHWPEPALVPR